MRFAKDRATFALLIVCVSSLFTTATGGLVGHWTFDEFSGTVAHDSSGNGNDGRVVGNPRWSIRGRIGGTLEFDGSTYVDCGNKPSLNLRDQITMSFWFKVRAFQNTWETFLAKGDNSYRASCSSGTGLATHMGVTGDVYVDGTATVTDYQWHHWAGTFDGTTITVYVDGRQDATLAYTGQIGDSSGYRLYIGANAQWSGRNFSGYLDDVRIYDRALTDQQVQDLMVRGISPTWNKAEKPDPTDGAVDVNLPLFQWTQGETAVSHNIYLGTHPTLTADDLRASHLTTTIYFHVPGLAPGTTYYWRVDEIDKDGITIHPGDVWSFTTATTVQNFTSPTIDDFESYTNESPDRLCETWLDGIGYAGHAGNASGATVGHDIQTRGTPYTTIAETTIVHGGKQSMPLYYDNTRAPFYSEAERTFAVPQDWASQTSGVLSLWFRGRSSNAPDPLYMALQDTAGGKKTVVYSDPQATRAEEWQQWQINLKVFADAGMNLQGVEELCLGVGHRLSAKPGGAGILYIDDIALSPAAAKSDHHEGLSGQGAIIGWGEAVIDSTLRDTQIKAIAAGDRHVIGLKADGSLVTWGSGSGDTPTGKDFIAIAAGGDHSLALKADGSIVGWGSSYSGNPPASKDFVAIAAGDHHGLALRADGSLVMWGEDDSWNRVWPPDGNNFFIAIAAGAYHFLALKSDGSIVGWHSSYLERDDTKDFGQATPPGGNDFVAIAAGHYHSLALKADGSIVGWGIHSSQIGEWPDIHDWGQTNPPAGNDFIAIAAGTYHSLALKADGSIIGWGAFMHGQTASPTGNDFITIAAGYDYSLALRADGSVLGWGRDAPCNEGPPLVGTDFVAVAECGSHRLALKADGSIVGSGSNWNGAATHPAGNDFTAIAAGYRHNLALKADGSIVAWGDNEYGQATPPAGKDFVAIAAGRYHSLALKADGSIAGWGWNHYGQATPPAGNDFIAIAGGNLDGLALKADGSIVGWGDNNGGWVTPPAGNDFIAIAGSNCDGLALKADGSIVGWGDNATPPAGTDFIAIAAGSRHSLALKADGSIVGWGDNWYGQATPPAGKDFIAIAAGGDQSLAIRRQ